MMAKSGTKRKLKLGYVVFVILVVTKIVEYLIGTRLHSGALPYLALLAVLASWIILYYFMHIGELRSPEEKDRD